MRWAPVVIAWDSVWILYNVYLPVFGPFVLLTGARFAGKLSDTQLARINPLVPLQDGALTWVGVVLGSIGVHELHHPISGCKVDPGWEGWVGFALQATTCWACVMIGAQAIHIRSDKKPLAGPVVLRQRWTRLRKEASEFAHRVKAPGASLVLTALLGYLFALAHYGTQPEAIDQSPVCLKQGDPSK